MVSRYDFSAHNAEGAFEEGIGGGGLFGSVLDDEAGFRAKNGSKRFFDGQAVLRLFKTLLVKGAIDGDGERSIFGADGGAVCERECEGRISLFYFGEKGVPALANIGKRDGFSGNVRLRNFSGRVCSVVGGA